jgi:hypothetical protein
VGTRHADLEEALADISETLVVPYWTWADLVTEAVPMAFAVFLAAGGDFRRSVPAAIRLGRDADTIGAIVGSLAGAWQGADSIPEVWRARVSASTGYCIGFVAGQEITEVADRLVEAATTGETA